VRSERALDLAKHLRAESLVADDDHRIQLVRPCPQRAPLGAG